MDEHHNFESIYDQLSLQEKDLLAKASQECFLIIGPEDEEEGQTPGPATDIIDMID